MKASILLAPLLLAGLAPFAAPQSSPAIGPAKTLPGDLVIQPAGGVQQFPAIAAGNDAHLAAWADHRSGFSGLLTGEGARDVYARLIGADGTPLTPLPFRVAGGLGRKQDVKVAWNGTHWLVTWRNVVPTATFKAAALFGARVDPQGNVLDDPPLVIKSYPWSSTFTYGLGADGNTWAVVIQGSQSGESNVEGWLVHPNGIPQQVNTSLFSISSQILDFQLVWDGSQYLFTWSAASAGIRGYRVTSMLGVLGSQITVAGNDTSEASITSDGTGGFLVSFTQGGFVGSDVRYRKVSAAGVPGAITTVTNSSSGEQHIFSSVAWNGNGYTLVWWRAHFATWSLHHARIDASGTLLTPGGTSFGQGTSPSYPEVSSLGDGNAQTVWVDLGTTPPNVGDVLGTRIRAAGVDAPVAVGSSTPRQGFADLTPGPTGYMAVFTSERAGSISIVAQRLNASGDAIDPEPIEVGAKSTYRKPAVAWNGQHYLVVWHDLMAGGPTDDVVLARRLAEDGTWIDPAPFQVLQGADPSVAAAGGIFLVAARFAWSTQIFRMHVARVDASGNVLDPTPIEVGANYARWPSVASFGDRWLVAWQRNPTHDNPSASAFARVVFVDGSMAPSQFLGGGSRPGAAASGPVGLVAWASGGDIHLRRLAADGSLLGGEFAATSAPNSQYEASAAWNGNEFLVAWQDQRNISAFFDDRHDIYATRVSEAGVVLDPAGLALAVSADEEQMPVVAGRDGAALVAYGDHVVGPPHATVRTTVVKVGGAACSAQSYCSTAPNSVGSGALMAHSGTTSVAANDLVLIANGGVPNQFGLFFYASGTGQVPFGDGFLCVSGQLFRLLPPQQIDAGGTAVRALDLASLPPAGQITPGSTWHFQFWYRDSAAGGAGFNLSNGRSFTFCD